MMPLIHDPVSIALAPGMLIPAAGFKGATFDVIVTLSEKPKEGAFPKALLTVAEGAASDGVYLGAIDQDADAADTDTDDLQLANATGRDGMYHQFLGDNHADGCRWQHGYQVVMPLKTMKDILMVLMVP